MKKSLLSAAYCLAFSVTYAQTAFTTMDSIDVNNINALILVHGDMFWDPSVGLAHCYFPKNSPASINFASALWMSGYDAGNNLHIAAQTYRQTGNDYWPGPLNSSDTLTYTTSQDWAKIWKVNRSDIQAFLTLSTHTTANTPADILTWPGKGNTNARGNGGVSLTITGDMAPFVDLNGNGIYEPLLGEYPDVNGDQALWWVFSDNGPTHSQTNGKPLGVEVHAMTYAYSRGTLIDNVVFFDYNIINKSANNYTGFRIGEWDDIDLGWYFDDFIGFDSSHRMGIQYNGNNDDGLAGGLPVGAYGTHIPVVGMTMIVSPGDAGAAYAPAGGFYYINNDASIVGNPTSDTEFNDYLRGYLRNGESFYDFMAPEPQCENHDSSQYYCYASDPSGVGQCSECALGNTPGDRRFIITTGNFALNAGASQHLVMAMVATYPDTLNGCPGVNFDSIRTIADTAWNIYNNPLPASVKNIAPANDLAVYPNPATDVVYIQRPGGSGNESIAIYNSLDQQINLPVTMGVKEDIIDVSSLPTAMYYILYRKDNIQQTAKFIKE